MTVFKTFQGTEKEYRNLHYWVRRQLGTPQMCENCGTTEPQTFEWANFSGNYLKDTSDWNRLCFYCHRLIDDCWGRPRKTFCRRGHQMSDDNIYVAPLSSKRHCIKCKRLLQTNWRAIKSTGDNWCFRHQLIHGKKYSICTLSSTNSEANKETE